MTPRSFGEKNGVWKTSTLPLLTANRSALTIDELNTVVAPNVVEWDDMSEPLAEVLSTLSVPPAYPGSCCETGQQVPAEERVLGAGLIVDPGERLRLVGIRRERRT